MLCRDKRRVKGFSWGLCTLSFFFKTKTSRPVPKKLLTREVCQRHGVSWTRGGTSIRQQGTTKTTNNDHKHNKASPNHTNESWNFHLEQCGDYTRVFKGPTWRAQRSCFTRRCGWRHGGRIWDEVQSGEKNAPFVARYPLFDAEFRQNPAIKNEFVNTF